ncbi:MAG: cysteine desulfurase [Candidatus Marinimicrobia bacterium]|nr:cysteine desulfurase [Candidatus Neomarinimicrobiota bacterium]
MPKSIYLDNQATTPLDPNVLKAMLPYYHERFGNAASIHHRFGREAKEAVEYAREILASELNVRLREIVFTSGATESINLAIRGVCDYYREKGQHIITQATEHKAVLDSCAAMEKQGWDVTYLPVDSEGFVNPEGVMAAIRPDTVMVAIMHSNNEIGTIQPIDEIGAICHSKGVFFLVDACQSFGKIPINAEEMHIDLLAATAHKIYGPQGIGMLYVRKKNPKIELTMQMEGGSHERGMRSGTLPVPLIVGFAEAVKICQGKWVDENARLKSYRDKMMNEIISAFPEVILNGSRDNRLPHNLNVCFTGLDAESLIMKMKGIACSTGSACSSANLEPSHVIKALGRHNELAHSAIRFSLGRFNTWEEIQLAIDEIIQVVSRVKKNSPHFQIMSQ